MKTWKAKRGGITRIVTGAGPHDEVFWHTHGAWNITDVRGATTKESSLYEPLADCA